MSKKTLIIGYNDVVNGWQGKLNEHQEDWFNFEEGVWNAPVDTSHGPYGDEVYIQGELDNTAKAVELVQSLDKDIDQLMVYVGSIRTPEREEWLKAIISAVREKSPDCMMLIFVCSCAQDKRALIHRVMAETQTGPNNWFQQRCVMTKPILNSDFGGHVMWYYAMICRRYGQDNMGRGKHLADAREHPSETYSLADLGWALGPWLT